MKNRKQETKKTAAAAAQHDAKWPFWTALAAAIVAAWWAWGAALHGPFLFDDNVLPFALPDIKNNFTVWIHNVRPVTMISYWMSAKMGGDDPYAYHVLSVVFHFVASGMVWLIVARLAEWAGIEQGRRKLLAGFAAAVFLLHPAQAESVAYLAGRAEVVSVMFAYAAFAVFVRRREKAVTGPVAAAVLVLFGLALLAKEQTIVLPALFLLTDFWWNPGFSFAGIVRNWKLYAPMALGAVYGMSRFWGLMFGADTAGFNLKDLTWYQYLFTEFRAIFVYIGTFVLPVRLTADWDFPISRTILDHGAIVGLLVLLALIAAAWIYRRRFPLASYGFFVFLLLLAPTSSILPIKDPVAERRLYFAMIGLLLVAVDFLSRARLDVRKLAGVCAAIAILAAIGAHARAAVWADPVALWEDTVEKSPNKVRTHFQLAQAYYEAGRFNDSITEFEKAAQIKQPDYNLLVDWGLAYDMMNRPDEAIAKLRQAAAIEPTAHIYSQIGMVYAKRQRWQEAIDALNTGEKLDPKFAAIYNYRAKVYFQQNQLCPAVADYRRALALDPRLSDAQAELQRAEAMARAAGGC
jgi:protein O-mannosyl-transferase